MIARLLCLSAVFLLLLPAIAVGQPVVELPQDSEAWYISVVGSDVDRCELLSWFDSHSGLVSLKRQVHFCSPTCDSSIYAERYAPNVSDLPTVRVQEGDGTVVYEVSGGDVPKTAQCLFDGIAKAVRKRRGGCVLPWRNEMERKCQPKPAPEQEQEPVPFTPPSGPPVIDDEAAGGVPVGLVALGALLSVACGAAGGLVVAFRKGHVQA